MKREKDTQQKVKTHISTFWRVGPTKLRYGAHGVERWGVFEKRKGIKKRTQLSWIRVKSVKTNLLELLCFTKKTKYVFLNETNLSFKEKLDPIGFRCEL